MEAAIGYARISTEDQSQNSLPGQSSDIQAYCQRNKLNLLKVFTDDGQSAFNFKRKEWQQVEQFIKANRQVKYLVVYAIDRFSRANLVDALQKMDEIQRRLNVKILTVTDPVDLNIDDFGTDLRRIVELLFANYELKKIRKRTSDGVYHANASGRWVNRAPYGYLNTRGTDGKPTLAVDEEKAFVVRMVFRMYLSGSNLDEIKGHAAANGMRLKGKSAIRRILENPVYAGLIQLPARGQHPAKVVQAIHPPVVTESDYWMAQDRLRGKSRASQRSDAVYLKSALRCHCGQMLSSDKAKGKSGKYYTYYVCKHHRQNLSTEKLHRQMSEILDVVSLPPDQVQQISENLKGMIREKMDNKGGDMMRVNMSLQKIRDRIAATQERFLSQPDIDQKIYNKVMAGLMADQTRLIEQSAALASGADRYNSILDELLPKLSNSRQLFEELPTAKKPLFIQAVFGQYLWYEAGVYRTPWIHPLFAHNSQELKEKGLLVIQQPSTFSVDISDRRGSGGLFEHLTDIWRVVA